LAYIRAKPSAAAIRERPCLAALANTVSDLAVYCAPSRTRTDT
jgi:hypothetical protein